MRKQIGTDRWFYDLTEFCDCYFRLIVYHTSEGWVADNPFSEGRVEFSSLDSIDRRIDRRLLKGYKASPSNILHLLLEKDVETEESVLRKAQDFYTKLNSYRTLLGEIYGLSLDYDSECVIRYGQELRTSVYKSFSSSRSTRCTIS